MTLVLAVANGRSRNSFSSGPRWAVAVIGPAVVDAAPVKDGDLRMIQRLEPPQVPALNATYPFKPSSPARTPRPGCARPPGRWPRPGFSRCTDVVATAPSVGTRTVWRSSATAFDARGGHPNVPWPVTAGPARVQQDQQLFLIMCLLGVFIPATPWRVRRGAREFSPSSVPSLQEA